MIRFWIIFFFFPAGILAAVSLTEEMGNLEKALSSVQVIHQQLEQDIKESREKIAPQLMQIEKLKKEENENSRWWRRWLLRRNLAELRTDLEILQMKEEKFRDSRQEQFHLLSAVLELLNAQADSYFENEALGMEQDPSILKRIFEKKDFWGSQMEALGYSDEHPFELVLLPKRESATQLYLEDRDRAMGARLFQLEAWISVLDRDLQLYRRVQRSQVLPADQISQKIDNLKVLLSRVQLQLKKLQGDQKILQKKIKRTNVH